MTSKPAKQEAVEPVNIKIVDGESFLDRVKGIYQSVAERAYALFEDRDHVHGHDLEDWFQAESELLLPVPIEMAEYDDRFTFKVEMPGFNEKEIEVSVEPCRLFISGKTEKANEQKEGETSYSEQSSSEVFRAINLPVEVDPAKAEAVFNSGVLNITLPKVVINEPLTCEI